jgi:hypothetical protein
MARGIQSRLRKIEDKARPKGKAVFTAWGRDQAEADRILADAKAAGIVRDGDQAEAGVWSLPSEMPRSGWKSLDEMSGEELTERFRVFCESTGLLTNWAVREDLIQFLHEVGRGYLVEHIPEFKGERP